jgi:general stress protein 26
MDSINRNQPEKNHEDLRAGDAVEQIRTVVKQSANCFFCTAVALGPSGGARPMNVRRVDDDGTLWFLSASDSHKNAELARDPSVTLYFQGSAHSDFLHLVGRADLSTDKAIIKELWEPILKTWFTGGLDDPRITAIRFTPHGGYYWDTKHGNAVAGVKMMIGAMVGKTLDDSIEGKLKV